MATSYAFTEEEKSLMRRLHGVGDTVIQRVEQIGFSALSQLAGEDVDDVTKQISQMMGSTCWHNSPQAKKAISAIIDLANQRQNRT